MRVLLRPFQSLFEPPRRRRGASRSLFEATRHRRDRPRRLFQAFGR
jgi:hypothetical protein